jgi:hypothetical protein
MTKREGAIISAYTGILTGEFSDFHEYAEEIIGRPIFTHDFASQELAKEIKKKSNNDFINMEVS